MKYKTQIVAEIGTSHQGNLQNAYSLIDEAVNSGADCVKFQWVYADEILHPKTGFVELPTGKISLYDRFKQLEVSPDFFNKVKEYVHSRGKHFMCSPFGEKSLNELFALKPDYIKIASPELNHTPLLEQLISLEMTQKKENRVPIILSSGVSTIDDIVRALKILSPLVQENLVSLLHCVTSYPAPVEDYNLSILSKYISDFKIPVGVSDHSIDAIIIPVLSTAFGGTIIEKHITLNKNTDGLDDPVALDPTEFLQMVNEVRKAEALDKEGIIASLIGSFGEKLIHSVIGNGLKELAPSEKHNYGRTNRSIHFVRAMKKGETITQNDIGVLRTEKVLSVGIEPHYLKDILHKTLAIDVEDGEGLQWEHLE